MRIIADTNILFSFFWKNSFTGKILRSVNFDLIAPEFALKEINKYKNEIIKKAKISEKDFLFYFGQMKDKVEFISEKEYSKYKNEAENISPDKPDFHFIALAMSKNIDLWSNDKKLKEQGKVRVLSTEDIVELLF